MFVNNCSIVFSKKEYIVFKAIWAKEEKQWRAFLSVNTDMNFMKSKIHTKLSPNRLWIIAKEDPSKRSFIIFLVQVVCMKIV